MSDRDYYRDMCVRLQAQVEELAEGRVERNAEIARLRALLKRISEWDALSGTVAPYGDGPYWRREIANALGGTPPEGET